MHYQHMSLGNRLTLVEEIHKFMLVVKFVDLTSDVG